LRVSLFQHLAGDAMPELPPMHSSISDIGGFTTFWVHSLPMGHDFSGVPRYRAQVTQEQFMDLVRFVQRIVTDEEVSITEHGLLERLTQLSEEVRAILSQADKARMEAIKVLRRVDVDALACNYEALIRNIAEARDCRSELANGRISNRGRTSMYCTVLNTFNWALTFTYPEVSPLIILPICVALSSPHPEFDTMPMEDIVLMAAASDSDLLSQLTYRPMNVGTVPEELVTRMHSVKDTLSYSLFHTYQVMTPRLSHNFEGVCLNVILALLTAEDPLTRWVHTTSILNSPPSEEEAKRLALANCLHFTKQVSEARFQAKQGSRWPSSCTVINAGAGVVLPAFRAVELTGIVSLLVPANKKVTALLRRAYGLPEVDVLAALPPSMCDIMLPASEEFPLIIERLTGGTYAGYCNVEDYLTLSEHPTEPDSEGKLFHKFLLKEVEYV